MICNTDIDLDYLVKNAVKQWENYDIANCRISCIKALKLIKSGVFPINKPNTTLAELYKCLGNVENMESNYTEALDYYSMALSICNSLNYKKLAHQIINNIGTIYYVLKEYKKAIDFYKISLNIKEKLNDNETTYHCYNNLARVYAKLSKKEYDENGKKLNTEEIANYQDNALSYLLYAQKLVENHNLNEKYTISMHNNMGSLFADLEKFDLAKEEFELGKSLSEKYHNQKSIIYSLRGLAHIYREYSDYPQAMEYLKQAEKYATEIKINRQLKFVYKDFAELYAKMNDFESAYQYQVKHSLMLKSIFHNELKTKIASIESHFEIEKKETEIQIIKLKNLELNNAYTEIRDQKEKIETLYADLNDFLGLAVHDLKNPASAILGLCELNIYQLENHPEDTLNCISNINHIYNQTEKILKIIMNLLNISAFETGRLKINPKTTDISEVLFEHEFYYQILADKKNIKFIIHRENTQQELLIDKEKIIDVMDNLITNAIKYTPMNGSVEIFCTKEENKYFIHVKDTGLGFYPDEINLLFKKYQTFSAKPTDNECSTGFGLMIVKKIVDLHNAKISVQSEKDKGSTFTIEFDLNSK
jgi:signal transduction histidine kinase